jgi:hypothetical protein
MTAIRRRGQGRILEELTREGRLSPSLLQEMQREFDGQDWVDPGLIGRLYERELACEKSKQRASGSFFTPDYLVDFVVEHTLGPLLEGRSLQDTYRLRILDPSCGGGAFLLGALRRLEAHCLAGGARPGPALRLRLCKTLVGVDLDPGAIEVTGAALRMAVGGKSQKSVPAKLVLGDALLPETEVGRIDAIVGNPPWGQKGLRIGAATRKRYQGLFTTARGVWDPFKFFVERCHQLLSPGGRWGLVLPDIVLLKNLQCVRDVILDGSAIEELAHCGRAFEDANIDAVAICATRVAEPVGEKHRLQVWPQLPKDWRADLPTRHRQVQAVFRELPGHKFNLYLRDEALALYRRLRSHERLGKRLEMHEGVHTGNSRTKLFVERKRNKHCVPLVLGRKELGPYQLSWAGRWLDSNPNLLDRGAGEYANLGRAEWHAREKIVVRRTGDRVMAAFDPEGLYVSNNMFVLLAPACASGSASQDEQFQRALVAMLNSRFMTWYFRAIQPRVGALRRTQTRSFAGLSNTRSGALAGGGGRAGSTRGKGPTSGGHGGGGGGRQARRKGL